MINHELVDPQSIVVIGGSNNTAKPGGKIVKNLIDGAYKGSLYVVNNKDQNVQGITACSSIAELPQVDLAIIAISSDHVLEAVTALTEHKGTKAFIVISAGFGELSNDGKKLEEQIAAVVNKVDGTLIGPNCIGIINNNYHGVFTSPIPKLHPQGSDFISSSGAMAVFIMEGAVPVGLQFNSIYSVGNAAQTSVEDLLAYLDDTFDPVESSRSKLIYVENIRDPSKFLKHSRSLIEKGCRIAAIKGGETEAGSRAAASHTGAMANSSMATRALFRKAGIVYCSSRDELISVASVFTYPELKGNRIAIVTHAGGSAVLLTDALTKGGLQVPKFEGKEANDLLTYLNPGASVANPIDFLATGTAEQLGIIIDYCTYKLKGIDAIVVVFGSPGLFDVENVYKVLNVKLDVSPKPIFPVLPSIINAEREIKYFLSKVHVNLPDEVTLANALSGVYNTRMPAQAKDLPEVDLPAIRKIINEEGTGLLDQHAILGLLDAADIQRTMQYCVATENDFVNRLAEIDFPLALKVVGITHKSDVNGVILNIHSRESAIKHFKMLMEIEGATGVLVQEMVRGNELFIGAKYEDKFGYLILVGIGGVFLELINDVSVGLAPLSHDEVIGMIRKLKGYKIIEGYRGKLGVDENELAGIVLKVCALVQAAPEIKEMDINPIIGYGNSLKATDVRIKIQKK